MSPSELLALAQSYLVDKALIVVVILLMLGYFLKRTPHVPDWSIPWLLTLAVIVLACGILQAYTMENSSPRPQPECPASYFP
ncbi:phage holin family protein, partial [Rhizobium ruizarguesonis]